MVMGMDGKVIQQHVTDKSYHVLGTAELPAGTYMIVVKQSDKVIFNRRLVVRR
jgi:hypothetical protein